MKALTAKMTRQLEAQLKAQRAAMLEAVRAELLRGDQQSYATIAGEVPDVGDQATAALLTDFDNEIARRHGEAMRELDAALTRLKRDPYFGICIECGDDIGMARLMAFPTATRCVTCQGQREKTYAHGAIPTL
jgi:DnaK suppressor protein